MEASFGDLANEKSAWITVFDTPYYPDTLDAARSTYAPILDDFAELIQSAPTSADLYRRIQDSPGTARGQLLRVFRKYVSPDTSVEMLKRKTKTEETITVWGSRFRSIEEVRDRLATRPHPDEAIIAILDEYRDRGQKGYALTEAFFLWFDTEFSDANWTIDGPIGAGRDIDLPDVIPGYPRATPVDFILCDPKGRPRVIGFARYDSDRGGAQEDDRVGGNEHRLREILQYSETNSINLKVLFLNDGPGLTLGSMWRDYAAIEDGGGGRVLVSTLKMAQAGRVSLEWMDS